MEPGYLSQYSVWPPTGQPSDHAITFTNYRFTWCSVVINVMFNTVKPSSIVSEGTVKYKWWMREKIYVGKLFILIIRVELYETYHYRVDFSFDLRIMKVFEVTR
jgi:hypothetical protein